MNCKTYHTIDADKVFRGFSPGRKQDITEWFSVVISAETVAVAVAEHVRQVEEFWYQLL